MRCFEAVVSSRACFKYGVQFPNLFVALSGHRPKWMGFHNGIAFAHLDRRHCTEVAGMRPWSRYDALETNYQHRSRLPREQSVHSSL